MKFTKKSHNDRSQPYLCHQEKETLHTRSKNLGHTRRQFSEMIVKIERKQGNINHAIKAGHKTETDHFIAIRMAKTEEFK